MSYKLAHWSNQALECDEINSYCPDCSLMRMGLSSLKPANAPGRRPKTYREELAVPCQMPKVLAALREMGIEQPDKGKAQGLAKEFSPYTGQGE